MPDKPAMDVETTMDRISKDFRMQIATDFLDSTKYALCVVHPLTGLAIYSSSASDGRELTGNMSIYFDREIL